MDFDDRRPVVVAARRTPIGRAGGALAAVDIAGLLSHVLADAVRTAGVDPADVDDVIVGNAADALGIDPAAVNRDGGAIALGHPFGPPGPSSWPGCSRNWSASRRGREAAGGSR